MLIFENEKKKLFHDAFFYRNLHEEFTEKKQIINRRTIYAPITRKQHLWSHLET